MREGPDRVSREGPGCQVPQARDLWGGSKELGLLTMEKMKLRSYPTAAWMAKMTEQNFSQWYQMLQNPEAATDCEFGASTNGP